MLKIVRINKKLFSPPFLVLENPVNQARNGKIIQNCASIDKDQVCKKGFKVTELAK